MPQNASNYTIFFFWGTCPLTSKQVHGHNLSLIIYVLKVNILITFYQSKSIYSPKRTKKINAKCYQPHPTHSNIMAKILVIVYIK